MTVLVDQNGLPLGKIEINHRTEDGHTLWIAALPEMPGYLGVGDDPISAVQRLVDEIKRGPIFKVKVSRYGSASHKKEIETDLKAQAAMRSIVDDGKRGDNVDAAAKTYKVSKKQIYAWLKRYDHAVAESQSADESARQTHDRIVRSDQRPHWANISDDPIEIAFQQKSRARAKFPKTT